MVKIRMRDLTDKFLQFAPHALAEDWDPVGLHFGRLDQEISRVLVTLDVRPETVQEAIDREADFIFSHHPPIFSAVSSFDLSNPQNRMYAEIIKRDIGVFAAHTNLDRANGGMNDWLAQALGLDDIEIMDPSFEYQGQWVGYGRVGQLQDPLVLEDFLAHVQASFDLEGLTYTLPYEIPEKIQRVAVMGGSGSSYYQAAIDSGAQAFITGDVTHHKAHDMQAGGLVVVDAGHHIESICIPHLAALFRQFKEEEAWDIDILESQVSTQPFNFYQ